MDLKELDSFRLSDAVAFHDNLNPKLFKGNKLSPLVKDQLITIAKDFLEELGIHDLDVRDITISGSNAAYSYTPHSDLDLHILVNMDDLPQSDVYKELFNAKKNVYNDTHDIKIHGIPVELYVQDANEPVKSLGEYSIKDDKWIKIPSKRRANFDQTATKAKYDKLLELVKVALKTKESSKLDKILKKIKQYRQAGLDKYGEFGPENLAYKALRSKGYITKLYDLRDKLHSEKLSIEGMYSQPKKSDKLTDDLRKEFEDYDPNGPPPGPEFKPTMPAGTVRVDVSDVYDWYKLGQHISNMKGLGKHDFGKGPPSTIMSFGSEPEEHKYIKDLEKTGLTTTDIDPIDKNQPKGMKRQKVDPTFNVNEEPEDWRPYQGLRDPKNEPGVNLFPGKDIVGQRVYHCTNSLKSIQKSGGLKPRADETGAREYGRLTTNEHPFIPVIGVWFSVGKPDWVGKYCLSFVIEPTDKVYVAYAKSKGDLTPNVVLNGIPIDRLKIEKREDVAEVVHPDVTSKKYFLDPTENIRMGDFEFNARTFTGSREDFDARGIQIRAYDPKRPKGNNLIGSADFIVKSDNKGNQWLESDDTEVDEDYWGAGIASMMYAFAKSLGNDIKPSPYQSQQGRQMWTKWGSDAEHLAKEGVAEERTNPEQNPKPDSGFKELASIAKTIDDPENWAISMTSEPKLGINPQVGISEDTPKGIYFYPLNYALGKIRNNRQLPWGNDYPYIQLFQYDRSHEMTKQTKVDPNKLKQALSQYCPEEVIQQAIDNPEYDGTPYWFIYDCLSRLGKNDETNVVRWNKVLRDLGFTSVYDDGAGWIAYNEPTQGVVLDPRVIKQHKTIVNKQKSRLVTPAVIEQTIFETMDMELASNRAWQAYDPDGSKLRQAAKEYAKKPELKPYYGKPGTEEIFDKVKGMGRYGARQLSDIAYEWWQEQKSQSKVNEASGYIPSEKEKNDPRFKTALTVDIKPDSIKKNAKAFSWLTSRAGIPPTAKPSGKF